MSTARRHRPDGHAGRQHLVHAAEQQHQPDPLQRALRSADRLRASRSSTASITIAIVAGLGVTDTSENGFALGWDEIKLPNPLFEGDTLYSESEVIDKRESRSKPQWGIVKFRTRGIKQDGTIVMEYTRSVMVWQRAHAPLNQSFPEPRVNPDGSPARS